MLFGHPTTFQPLKGLLNKVQGKVIFKTDTLDTYINFAK